MKKLLIIALTLLLCGRGYAATLEADGLAARLTALCASYETRVGVAFIDLRSGKEFSLNGAQPFMAASVAKVPVMAAAFHLSDLGRLDLQQKLVFREEDKLGGSGILQWMRGGTAYTRWNLARMMIVLSDNTATRLLVDDLGLPAVNGYINTIGLRQTAIVDPTMLNEPPATALNKTSPLDMAHLLAMIARSPGFFRPLQKRDDLLYEEPALPLGDLARRGAGDGRGRQDRQRRRGLERRGDRLYQIRQLRSLGLYQRV